MLTFAPRNLATFEEAIRDSIGRPRYELWFQGNTKLTLENGTLEIGVPNRFYREWLESHFQEQIRSAAKAAFGQSLKITFHIDPSLFQRIHTAKPGMRSTPSDPPAALTETVVLKTGNTTILPTLKSARDVRPAYTPSRYSLSKFVVGPPNRVAHAAAAALLENPKAAYSPLFIHAGVGLGKTHLLKGIEEGLKLRQREPKLAFVSCEMFTNEFVEAMRTGKLTTFRKKYRQLDFLLVEDVQFLCNKRATQEEFFHTLNALETRGAKVVLSCDTHPRRLTKMTEELKSRFVAGMVAKIDPPNLEMRRQLLRDKAARKHLELDAKVIDFLAEKLCSNVCELEGALNYLEHYSDTMSTPLDVSTAQTALAEILRHSVPVLRVPEVKKKFCEVFGLHPKQITERSRSRAIAHPRMMVLYLARRYTSATYSEIGDQIGGLNHSTVIAAEKKVLNEISRDGEIVLGDRPWKVRDVVEAFERELGRVPS